MSNVYVSCHTYMKAYMSNVICRITCVTRHITHATCPMPEDRGSMTHALCRRTQAKGLLTNKVPVNGHKTRFHVIGSGMAVDLTHYTKIEGQRYGLFFQIFFPNSFVYNTSANNANLVTWIVKRVPCAGKNSPLTTLKVKGWCAVLVD